MLEQEDDIKELLQKRVLERLNLSNEVPDEVVKEAIQQEIILFARDYPVTIPMRLQLERETFFALRRFDVLSDLLEDDEITEIMVNGPHNIFIERCGKLYRTDKKFSSQDKLEDIIQLMVACNNQLVNEASPIVDTRLPDKSRVNIVLPPIAIDHPIISIRKFPKERITMQRLVDMKSVSIEVAKFLEMAVISKMNIFISGGTGSGKTTLLNALTEFIPQEERVITIEDSAELQVIGIPNLVRLEARNATLEGKLEVDIQALVKTALRMRPDRMIVGECRGKEALEVLQACNTGHDGSLSTGHANSCQDMIARLETMSLMGTRLPIEAIRQQIASGIDLFVQIGRVRDKSRKILEIAEVKGMSGGEVELNSIYQYIKNAQGEEWQKIGALQHTQKIEQAGYQF